MIKLFTSEQIAIPIPDREPEFELVGYLKRWYIFPKFPNQPRIYLHNILDGDEHIFHDHPWDFHIHILSGGYTEYTPDGENVRRMGDYVFKRATDQHYLDNVLPNTWTIIQTSTKWREWGFWPEKGVFVHHDEYNSVDRKFEVIYRLENDTRDD